MTLSFWYKLTKLELIPHWSINDVMIFSFRALKGITRDKILWKIVCLTLI